MTEKTIEQEVRDLRVAVDVLVELAAGLTDLSDLEAWFGDGPPAKNTMYEIGRRVQSHIARTIGWPHPGLTLAEDIAIADARRASVAAQDAETWKMIRDTKARVKAMTA